MPNNTATNSKDGPYTIADEINAILSGLGVTPASVGGVGYQNDVTALEAQIAGESGWYGADRSFNPLNTSLHIPGADSKAIPDYATFASGVDATVSTLLHTSGNPYAKAVADLKAGKAPQQYLADIAASPWDAGRYGTKNGGSNKLLTILKNAASSHALNTIGLQSAQGISKYGQAANNGTLDPGQAIDEGILPGAGEALNGVAGAVDKTVSWTEGLGKLLSNLTSASFWRRVGLGAAGIVMVLMAVAIYNEKSISTIAKTGAI